MRIKFSFLVCLAACCCTATGSAKCQQETTAGKDSCLRQTTLKVAQRDFVVTLQDAERIKLTVKDYLTHLKPQQKPSVPEPGDVSIDCWGTVRMGEWILESSAFAREPELRLTIRIHNSEILIVRKELRLQHAEGQWKVVGEARVTYHRQLR